MNRLSQIQKLLCEKNYDQLVNLCEQSIEIEAETTLCSCYLGLAYLLLGQEETAQTTWLWAMVEQGLESELLVEILEAEAQRQAALKDLQTCWLIRQHIREIAPENLNNLLHLIQLSIKIQTFSPAIFEQWQVLAGLRCIESENLDRKLLLQTLELVLQHPSSEAVEFAEAAALHAQQSQELGLSIINAAIRIGYKEQQPKLAARLIEVCHLLSVKKIDIFSYLAIFHTNAGDYQKAVEAAKELSNYYQTPSQKAHAEYVLLKSLISAGAWSEIEPVVLRQENALYQIIETQHNFSDIGNGAAILTSTFFFPYLEDNPTKNRWFHNQIAQLFQKNLPEIGLGSGRSGLDLKGSQKKILRIGYIANTFRQHSVGWLSRWLFKYHDRESFEIVIYTVLQREDALTQNWFKTADNTFRALSNQLEDMVQQVREDQLDILVELDSLTSPATCTALAYKLAPIQVTWLGWDATGLPAIDYFIADPYVLPDNAQEYYQEKIWRLPHTYVAVDGFEVGVPTLRREDLEIPSDAIIYYSAQRGYKRHPQTARLQLKILKAVPNSYFLIKGIADEKTIKAFFTQLAEEEGVDPNRLRYLPGDPNEYVHRANLSIADVVLDTYPYNGATTTLETLWMGIPIVTRAGQQFSARNSYTFMVNAGVTEGIAWSAEEYIEWGVRLGKDEALRQKIHWQLLASRRTSPLWNAQRFTREMENAYRQMWQAYVSTNISKSAIQSQ